MEPYFVLFEKKWCREILLGSAQRILLKKKKKSLILAMHKAFGIDAMAPDIYLTCTAITCASVRGYKYAILLSPLRF
jgi:hypothetical protein